MDELKREARIAGLFYLVVVLVGPFVLLYVPGRIFVEGDVGATARNILAQETLFRASILLSIVSQIAFVLTVLALYRLLRRVDADLAGVMVILILLDAPVALQSIAHQVATLAFVRGAEFLAVFDEAQRHAVATFLLQVDRHGALVSEVFWGLWLLPLGVLVWRSGFLPRFLGGWLFVNGLAYLATSTTGLVAPQYRDALFTWATPILFGEVALTLWLLIVGARVRRDPATPAPAAAPG
jgi:hypothetical protein